MKTILDLIRDEGRNEGRNEGREEGRREGEIKTIETVALLRFQKKSERLTSLLPKFNDLSLLEQICQFAMVAASLFDVEKFAESLLQIKPSVQSVAVQ